MKVNKSMAWIGAAVLTVLLTLHHKAQKIGDERIWANRSNAAISFDRSPCESLKNSVNENTGRAPAMDALIQMCIAKTTLDQQGYNRTLDAAIPHLFASNVNAIGGASPAQTAMSLRPELAKSLTQQCQRISKTRPRLCNPATQIQVDKDAEQALAEMIASTNERHSELALKWALTLGKRAQNISDLLPQDNLKTQSAAFMLKSRASSRKQRLDLISMHLKQDDPLRPIATLEAIHMNQNDLKARIDALIVASPQSLAAALGRQIENKSDY